ncbi:MAG: hypothetical protein AAGD28_03985, partial [Bacteroidota bacterium]
MNKIQNFVQIISLLAVSCCFFFGSCTEGEMTEKGKAPIEYVDPFSDKQVLSWAESLRELEESVLAPEIPILGLPFAQTHWTLKSSANYNPCTGDSNYPLKRILAIRPTHWNLTRCYDDYGTFNVQLGSSNKGKSSPVQSMSLEKELADPISFRGNVPDLGAEIQFATSSRAALFQLNVHEKDTLVLGISPHQSSRFTKINFYPASGEIWIQDSLPDFFPGLNIYYLIQTKNKYADYGVWQANLRELKETQLISTNPESGFYIKFPTDTSESLQFKIAGSYWDIADARLNLRKEIPDWDIDGLKVRGRN